jgi:hypothetical protein
MTYEALLKVAPILTLERYNDPRWNRPGRSMYEPGSLRFAPAVSSVPLLVDHRDDREVGVVHELFRAEWVDGPWVCARATVSDPPAWLKKYDTKVSVGFHSYSRRAADRRRVVGDSRAAAREGWERRSVARVGDGGGLGGPRLRASAPCSSTHSQITPPSTSLR